MKKSIHSQAQNVFCDLLRAARKERKLRQQALAARLGRPQSFIAKVERGERRLDVVEFVRYARALKITPTKLISSLERNLDIWD